jgi:SWIM/SEC-C metal-binding protein
MKQFGDMKVFDGKKTAKLGTKNNPAVVTVQTKARAKELEAIFKDKEWVYEIIIDKKKEEDISALDILQHPVKTFVNKKDKVGRNDPCPCGSGKKYKYCHGAK